MPIILRAETDILRLRPFVHGFLNPTNTRGAMSMGLALAYRNYYGEKMYKDFLKQLEEGLVHVGRLTIYKDEEEGIDLIHLPTKAHYADPYEMSLLKKSLCSLREFLQDHPYYSIAMPLLGYAIGDLDKSKVWDLNFEYLDDLPNPIFGCMLPKAFDEQGGIPKYLGVVGSTSFDDRAYVLEKIKEALKAWDMKPEDLSGIVSTGDNGIDRLICGVSMTDDSYGKSIAKELGIKPLIISSDAKRYGRTTVYRNNSIIADISTHFVALIDGRSGAANMVKPKQALRFIHTWNDKNDVKKKVLVHTIKNTG